MTWDDHEVANDYAGIESADVIDPAVFGARRAAAYRAYYEHMPLAGHRPRPQPDGSLRLFQRYVVGNLLDLSVLDIRQYRSDQACDGNGVGGGQLLENCTELTDPRRTMSVTSRSAGCCVASSVPALAVDGDRPADAVCAPRFEAW